LDVVKFFMKLLVFINVNVVVILLLGTLHLALRRQLLSPLLLEHVSILAHLIGVGVIVIFLFPKILR